MNNPIKLLLFLFALTPGGNIHAQSPKLARLGFGTEEPYRIEVTYNKTTHLIFPAGIRYVDLGSEYLIAGKAKDAENVLRVKAAVRDFEVETNFSVITDDGRFYNFNVFYSPHPRQLNFDLITMRKSVEKFRGNDVLFEELGDSPPSLVDLLLKTIHKKNKKIVKHIGSESFGIRFALKGIYTHGGKYYFHTELKNSTDVPFHTDFITFKITDKKIGKRTVVQERQVTPLRMHHQPGTVGGMSIVRNVFLLDQFTLAGDRVLLIEIFEKNGGRHQTLQVENSDLVNALLVNDMHLKF